jgi:MoxR-like ATPase
MKRIIVGQDAMLERVLVALLTGGHVLLEGVPGLAKTLTVRTLATVLGGSFSRIQFTPDLVPADLVGTRIWQPGDGTFRTELGPVFANLLLADEINRAPAKVQSALLEAMQERQVTIGDTTHPLPEPFLVMATQNPIEQEGTYALPEAQLDRFMLMIKVGYPTREEERAIMDRMTSGMKVAAEPVATPEEIAEARSVVGQVYMDEKIRDYIVSIVHATREPKAHGLGELADFIQYGASPRASIYLNLAARAHAFLRHRGYVTPEDIKAIGVDVLRHRVILTYEAEAEEITSETVVRKLFEHVEVP